jgi:hypothetical protein
MQAFDATPRAGARGRANGLSRGLFFSGFSDPPQFKVGSLASH